MDLSSLVSAPTLILVNRRSGTHQIKCVNCFTMNNGLIQRNIPAIGKMIALMIFPSSTNHTFSLSSNESAQPRLRYHGQNGVENFLQLA